MHITDLNGLLKQVRGTTFAQIKAKTKVSLIKGSPFKELNKVAWLNVCLNPIYENSVNKALAKQGSKEKFKAAPLPWGSFVDNKRLIIENKGKYYLRMQINKVSGVVYVDSLTGNIYSESEIKQWLRPRKETQVTVRNFSVENILEIKAFKQKIS